MGVNDDRLSPREHDEMRSVLLGGAHRIKPVGAHRRQFVAGALSLLLVGLLAASAVTTSYIVNANTLASTPSPTPTASPTASPTPTLTPTKTPSETPTAAPSPAAGIAPFADICANALNADEVTSAVGRPMGLSDFQWRSGETRTLGGIDCFWTSTDVYAAASVSLVVYPTDVVPSITDTSSGCLVRYATNVCRVAGQQNGVSIFLEASGMEGANTDFESAVSAMYDEALGRLRLYPLPVAPVRTAAWWTMPDCAELASSVNALMSGYEVSDNTDMEMFSDNPRSIPYAAGVTTTCDLTAIAAGDPSHWVSLKVIPVAGGAIDFPTIPPARYSSTVVVPGAQDAATAGDNDRLDGARDRLVVTDGVNLFLLIAEDWNGSEPSEFTDFAAAVLTALG